MILLALCALLATAGCNGNKVEPDKGPPPDVFGPASLCPFDKGPEQCGPGIYPCAPYGTENKTVAANLEFLGFRDPEEPCKAHKDKVLDLDNKVRISIKDFHLGFGDTSCTKRALLWVLVSAGWCGPCQREVCKTVRDYQAGAVDGRVAILNVVFETDKLGTPVTEDFAKLWITQLRDPDTGKRCLTLPANLSFPVVMDPSFKMGVYFTKESVPFNMLIDTSNMKIYFRQVGENLPAVGQQIQNFFAK
jgi:thiol-disulfide isomerase/thioredoxin